MMCKPSQVRSTCVVSVLFLLMAAPTIATAADALFVVGSVSLGSGDSAVESMLQNMGYVVTVVDDSASTTGDAAGMDVVVISSTVNSNSVTTKFRDVAVPVVNWEQALQDDMDMVDPADSGARGTVNGQTQVAIVDSGHDLADGYSGNVTVYSSPQKMSWGKPNVNAATVATLTGDSTRVIIYGYETGASMYDGATAAARRVHFFLENTGAAYLTVDGVALFEAAINWATNAEAANVPPTADAGLDQNVTDTDDSGDEPVTLDGAGSSDSDGTIVSYVWEENSSQIATGVGPIVTLTVATHTIDLTVTDDDSATDTDSVVITVNPYVNVPPTADAGPDQNVTDSDRNGAEDVTLDGSGSSDSDGTIVSYSWEEATVQIATGVSPVVTLDTSVHTIDLIVTDDDTATDTDSAIITVNADPPLTHNFNGGGDGASWDDPANWAEGTVPVTTSTGDNADPVVIDGAYAVLVTSDVIAVNSITIDGNATLTIAPGVIVKTNGVNINNGGLILQESGGSEAELRWGKANRSHFYCEADGYVAGAGTIETQCNSQGTRLRSTRSADFDMTNITLILGYGEPLSVCSTDSGRDSAADFDASNFTIGTLILKDYRYTHLLSQSDGLPGPGTNALYCLEIKFNDSYDHVDGNQLDLQGTNVYVRDQVTWWDDTTDTTPQQIPVATAYDFQNKYSAFLDDDAPQGEAYIGLETPSNIPPTADAGPDQEVNDADDSGAEDITLDGSGSFDTDGTIVSYVWEENSSQIATGVSPVVSLDVNVHTIDLTVADDDSATDTDSVVITVTAYVNQPPTADAGPDQNVTDSDDSGAEDVTLDGSASSDSDGTIVSYVWEENSSQIATGVGPVVSLDVDVHTIDLTVTDDDAATDTDSVVITVEEWSVTSSQAWQTFQIANQTGQFEFSFDMVPNLYPMDAVTGVGAVPGAWWTDLACIVRIAAAGVIDVRNGDAYAADAVLPYAAGTKYHVRMAINIYSHTYDVFVTPEGQSEVQLADDYAFRTEQASITNIEYWTINATNPGDSHTVSNVTVTTIDNDPPVADAGPDQNVNDADDSGAEDVTLDGSGSSDSDGTIVSYDWEEASVPIASGVSPTVSMSVAVHTVDLTVTDDDSATDTDSVTITVTPYANVPPTADAGPDQNVNDADDSGAEDITLDGSGSSDSDGTIVSYEWEESSVPIATGVSPVVSLSVAVHTIDLIVTDDDDATDADSVTITVTPYVNVPPTADAGPDQNVTDDDDNGAEDVTLDGSGSSDSDGTIVSYEWEESSVPIATGVSPVVSLSVAVHTIDLIVTDDDDATDADSVVITVNPHINVAPTADAGPDQNVTDVDSSGDEDVTLDGSASSDSDGAIVSYEWEESSVPIATGVSPIVTLTVAAHTIDLTVTDDDSATDSDSVVVTVEAPVNQAPTVDAGTNLTITMPDNADLDGAVTDDGLPNPPAAVTTTWTKVSGPGDVYFADPAAVDTRATFTADGVYSLQLEANDSALSTTDTVTVTVEPAAGGALTSSTDWQSATIASQTGDFTAEFDAVPHAPDMDGVTGLCLGVAAGYSDLACIVRFHPSGYIDVRNGGAYAYDVQIFYVVGDNYHVRMEVDVATHSYDVFVTPEGGSEVQVANDYAFRSEQAGVASLDHWSLQAPVGSHTVSNMAITSANAAPTVDAGGDLAIVLGGPAVLDGTVSDDGQPDPPGSVTVTWTQQSGPGTATFADANAVDTTATFDLEGAYVLQLEAYDGELSDSDTATVTVNTPSATAWDWTGAGDGVNWSDPNNWLEGTVPLTTSDGEGAGDVVINGAYNVHVDADVISMKYLTINGGAVLTVDTGLILRLQSIDLVSGGLFLDSATVDWGKANRGHLYVEADGYIAGSGVIKTLSNSGGVQIRSTRSGDFDMTDIELEVRYVGGIHVASVDMGRADGSGWAASNYAIKRVFLYDRRYDHQLFNKDGSIGDQGNALYCMELQFGGDADETAGLDLQGINLYVRDRLTWRDGTYIESDTQLTVATAKDGLIPTSAVFDDDTPQGDAYVNIAGGATNTAPTVDAGSDDTITLPAVANLDGTVSDDGLPDPPATVTVTWTKVSGAGTVTFGDANAVDTTATFSTDDVYVLQLEADDSQLTAADTVTITVNPATGENQAPTVDAGGSQTITLPAAANLDGTVSDDGLPDPPATVTTTWTKISGSGTVTFGDANAVDTTATFSTDDVYVLQLEADDSELSATDTVTITVNPQGSGGGPVSPLSLTNHLSGISVSLSGGNGTDWAVERTFHEEENADVMLYMHSDVSISLAHNTNNTLMKRDSVAWANWDPITGPYGNGEAGDIHYKIDRDLQAHSYRGGTIPTWAPLYSGSLDFDTLTYEGSTPVLGATGDNGGAWGSEPSKTVDRFAYGQIDAFGNEWHTLTYWDDDEPVYASIPESSHRQGASDGHWVYICVNPITPVIQFVAPDADDQYYTTPLKTYFVPKTWDQTTYLTSGVEIQFLNITNGETIEYRVDGGAWQQFGSTRLVASDIIPTNDTPTLLEFRNGSAGAIASRTIVMNPGIPASSETHGFLLWADAAEKAAIHTKLTTIQPFVYSYNTFKGSYYQSSGAVYTDARGGWRSGAGMASSSLSNAFATAMDGPSAQPALAALAKERLLRMARLEAVGNEADVNAATPSKDYINELGQTVQQFADAGVAYDLLASCYRSTQDPDGMTPIEEIRIRDGLGEIAKNILQMRANYSFSVGGGDTHWAHGYELAFGIIAASMPTYATPYFGVSGGDMVTVNDLQEGGYYWNPFPDQGVTWYEAATDPAIDTPGHPNVKAPIRAEALLTDNGWWTGPNDYQGDGNRYFDGPIKNMLVDLGSSGMANAECRVELVEMSGYESPFSGRLHVFDFIRRIRGDNNRQTSVTSYIRRRLMNGYVPLVWDGGALTYTPAAPRAVGSLLAFNNHNEAASLPSAVSIMSQFLSDVNKYYGYEPGTPPSYIEGDRKSLYGAYALALMWDPSQIDPHQSEPNHAPIIKPLLKHVVHPGEQIYKELIVMDPDDDTLTISVTDLPAGASYNSTTREISWTPSAGDAGVHVATVTADDGTVSVTAHWPMIVKADAPSGPVPSGPVGSTATLNGDDITVSWTAPGGVSVARYIVWKDGIPIVVLPSGTTSWTDYDLPSRTHTRYHVSLLDTNGAESGAAVATGYLYVP